MKRVKEKLVFAVILLTLAGMAVFLSACDGDNPEKLMQKVNAIMSSTDAVSAMDMSVSTEMLVDGEQQLFVEMRMKAIDDGETQTAYIATELLGEMTEMYFADGFAYLELDGFSFVEEADFSSFMEENADADIVDMDEVGSDLPDIIYNKRADSYKIVIEEAELKKILGDLDIGIEMEIGRIEMTIWANSKKQLLKKIQVKVDFTAEETEVSLSMVMEIFALGDAVKIDIPAHVSAAIERQKSGPWWPDIGLKFTLNPGAASYSVGAAAVQYGGKLEVPSMYAGKPVTGIGYPGFRDCVSLTEVILPEGITNIGYQAFQGCAKLTAVTFPDSLTGIEDFAFEKCSSLASVTLPDGVTVIGDYAFRGCGALETVNIPDGIKQIGLSAFSDCKKLNQMVIPDSVTQIKNYAFMGCIALAEIRIPDGVTSIGENTFRNCRGLTKVLFGADSQLESIGLNAFSDCVSLSEIALPATVARLGGGAFGGCKELHNVSFGENNLLTGIESGMFSGCVKLNDIVFPDTVKTIGQQAFDNSGIWLNAPDNDIVYAGKFLVGIKGTVSGSIAIRPGVQEIGSLIFDDCDGITSVSIPASVERIGEFAFRGNDNLTTVSFEKNSKLTETGMGVFDECGKLVSVSLENCKQLTRIQAFMFSDCASLSSISIPDTVTCIDGYAFLGCANLKTVTFGAASKLDAIIFHAFDGCKSLQSFTIPQSVTEISGNAFGYCTGITSIVIPFTVTRIEEYAFAGWTESQTIYIKGRSQRPSGWQSGWHGGLAKEVWNY